MPAHTRHKNMQEKQVDWFENWFDSPYYSILYKHRNMDEAKEFVENLIAYLRPPLGSKMADIACGEGRHSRQLEAHGFDVIGTDLSNESIKQAKKYESDTLQFFVHDMRSCMYTNYFDYAFNFFTSFGYFETHHDHEMAARSFASRLKKGGTLVIDYLNKEKSLSQLKAEDTIEREGITFNISKKLENGHFIKHIKVTDRDGTIKHFHESVAAFTLEDFLHIFQKAGLTLMETFGDYHLHPYDPITSPRMIMIFKK